MKKVVYTEPKGYFPEEVRKEFKLGEFAEDEKKGKKRFDAGKEGVIVEGPDFIGGGTKMKKPEKGEFSYEIKEEIGVLSESSKGWRKEVNIVSYNGAPGKIDIRDWAPEHAKMGKGITLDETEAYELICILQTYLEHGVPPRAGVSTGYEMYVHEDAYNGINKAPKGQARQKATVKKIAPKEDEQFQEILEKLFARLGTYEDGTTTSTAIVYEEVFGKLPEDEFGELVRIHKALMRGSRRYGFTMDMSEYKDELVGMPYALRFTIRKK